MTTCLRFLRLLSASAAFVFLLLPLQVSGQSQESPQLETRDRSALVLRKTVRRVIVDVIVEDRDGKSITDLSPRDFTVFEDGAPQQVLSFEKHDLSPSIAIPDHAAALPHNVFVNVPSQAERGPLYIIFYDLVNTDPEDQMFARKQLLEFIDSRPAGTRFAIFYNSDRIRLLQGFTSDSQRLHAAIVSRGPGPHLPNAFLMGKNLGRYDPVVSANVLEIMCNYVEGLPGRKNLIWFSGGFPLRLFAGKEEDPKVIEQTKEALSTMARNQVSLYPINIRGVVVNDEGRLTGGGPHTAVGGAPPSTGPMQGPTLTVGPGGKPVSGGPTMPSTGGTSGPDAAGVISEMLGAHFSTSSLARDYAVQEEIAKATGGRAFYSTNDVKGALLDASEHGANYYTLSYAPTNSKDDGGMRNIRIKISRGDCKLWYRRFYYSSYSSLHHQEGALTQAAATESTAEASTQESGTRPSDTLSANMWHGAPMSYQVVFKVRIEPEGAPRTATREQMDKLESQTSYWRERKKTDRRPVELQTYSIYYMVGMNQFRTSGQATPLQFSAVAFDDEGHTLNAVFERAGDGGLKEVRAQHEPSSPAATGFYQALQELEVPADAVSLRVAVWDTQTDRIGAMEIPLPLKASSDR